MKTKEGNLNKKLDEVLEIVHFIKDNAATKVELNELRVELKEEIGVVRDDLQGVKSDLQKVKNEMLDHVDGFIKLYKNQESENAALGMRMLRLESSR